MYPNDDTPSVSAAKTTFFSIRINRKLFNHKLPLIFNFVLKDQKKRENLNRRKKIIVKKLFSLLYLKKTKTTHTLFFLFVCVEKF